MTAAHTDTTPRLAACPGFTLIELSIVLVIIGLLVGGVLVGKTLYYSAQLTTAGRDVDMLKSDIALFKEKYNCLPGDCANASEFFPTCTDDWAGDGWIYYCNGDGDGKYYGAGEGAYKFYQHLSLAGLNFYGQYNGAFGTAMTPGINVPKLSWIQDNSYLYPQGGITYAASAVSLMLLDDYWCYPGYNNGCEMNQPAMAVRDGLQKILITPIRRNGHPWPSYAGLYRSFAADVDNKYDDGIPNTGTIRSLNWIGGSCTNSGGARYNTGDSSADACVVAFLTK